MRLQRSAPALLVALWATTMPFAEPVDGQQRSIRIAPRRIIRPAVRPSTRSANRSSTRSVNRVPTRQLGTEAPTIKDEIPESALLTDRGTELANRLRYLRLSEETMGSKHPSLESVRDEIENIKIELAAWSTPATGTQPSNDDPGDMETVDQPNGDELAEMNDRDMRQLVLHLVGKVRLLEARVEILEQDGLTSRATSRADSRSALVK